MIILYGLGNNEAKYIATKHNAGRVAVQQFAKQFELPIFHKKSGFYYTKSNEFCCVFSNGYMNESGNPLAECMSYFNFSAQNGDLLIIVHDDSDQKEGAVKLVAGGGHAGHKGIASVYANMAHFGYTTEAIWRLKIGIRPALNTKKSETFVLSKMSVIDEETCQKIATDLKNNTEYLTYKNLQKLQNILNSNQAST